MLRISPQAGRHRRPLRPSCGGFASRAGFVAQPAKSSPAPTVPSRNCLRILESMNLVPRYRISISNVDSVTFNSHLRNESSTPRESSQCIRFEPPKFLRGTSVCCLPPVSCGFRLRFFFSCTVLHLVAVGLSETRIGLLLTLTLVGDTAISLCITLSADRIGRRRMLIVGLS